MTSQNPKHPELPCESEISKRENPLTYLQVKQHFSQTLSQIHMNKAAKNTRRLLFKPVSSDYRKNPTGTI